MVKRCLVQPLTTRVLAFPRAKFYREEANEAISEETKDPQRTDLFLFVESSKLHPDCDLQRELLSVFNRVVRAILHDQDSLLTDSLAEEFEKGMQVFLSNVVGHLAEPLFRDLFLENAEEVATLDMIESFFAHVERVKEGVVPNDQNIQSKGKPRKGQPGKRSQQKSARAKKSH